MHWCLWIACLGLVNIYVTEGAAKEESRAVVGRIGESVILKCDLLPYDEDRPPHYVIEWVRFGFLLPIFIKFGLYSPRVDPEYLGRTRLEEGASLQIDLLRSEDQGWYECRVLFLDRYHSDENFRNGTWIHLTVNSPPSFRETPPALVEVRDGDSISLTCVASGNPQPHVVWKQDGIILTSGGQLQVNNGSLKIGRVVRTSAGVYTCHATSGEGEITHTTRLLVQGPPIIVVPPENTTVNISQNAFLACQAEAYPANLTYTWLQGNNNVFHLGHLQSRVRILVDGSLLLHQVIPEDSGKYTCVPSNGILHPPSSSAYLTVLHPAKVTNMPLNTYLPIGMLGVIKCPVRANPPLLFVNWTKDGQPLKLDKFPGWYMQQDGSIVIATGNDDALGMYTCTPYNSYGTAGESSPTRVLLKDPPEFVNRPKEEYFQEVGRELIVPCSAKGDPAPTIIWAKVGSAVRIDTHTDANNSLVFRPLTKEEHGIWECSAANRVARISTLASINVLGTSPHAVINVSAVPLVSAVNVSWVPGFDGGYLQRFSVWVRRLSHGHHEWTSLAVPVGVTHILVENLLSDVGYQFSVLSQNKLGSGPFSEIVPAYPLAFAVTTVAPEVPTNDPALFLSSPRFLSANETSQGVLLRWKPPLHTSVPITGYALEFRQDSRAWELLDDTVAGTETKLFVPGLIKDSVYEFRLVALAGDYISDPSNTVNISTTGMEVYPSRTQLPEILPQPVMAGVIAGICFLCMAVVFSTLAACVMNRRRALRHQKRRQDLPIVFSPNKKSSPSQNSNGSSSSDSMMKFKMQASPYQSFRKTLMFGEKAGTSCGASATRGNDAGFKYTMYESHFGESIPLERISRGPDGRFMVERETPPKAGNVDGFPYVTETDLYPNFHTRESSMVNQCLDVKHKPYLQVSTSTQREHTGWENEVTLRPKATGQAGREARASGYRQGKYFGHSSPIEETKQLSIINISPVTPAATLPYSKIEEKRQEVKSPEERLDRTLFPLKDSLYDYSFSLPRLGNASSLLNQKSFDVQTKGSRLSTSAQSGILQYLSLPFFKEMSVDGDWPLQEEHSRQDFDTGSPETKSQGFQTVLDLDNRTLGVGDRLTQHPGLDSKVTLLPCPDYMDTSDNQESSHCFSPVQSFLKPPEKELGPTKPALTGRHLWTCPLNEDVDRGKAVDSTDWGPILSTTELPVDSTDEKALSTTFHSEREWESSVKEHPEHKFRDFHMLEKQKPLTLDKPLAPLFLHGSPSEKVLRNSLTSQSSGRGSLSFLRPSSLAQSIPGSYLSSPVGETASWHSGGGSQGSSAEEGRNRKESFIHTIGKRRNTSVDENYEWDTEFTVETDILDALHQYRNGHPKRPISTIAVQELERQSLKVPPIDEGTAGNSLSLDVLDFSRSHTLVSPEARCAALKEEFLQYRRRDEDGRQRHVSGIGLEDDAEQSTLL
ncbi:protein turtle homolog A isoform X2 [Pleurodeles waltl]|uniref:protein turtle homolog A isoform X2 n=1 Tax=Pleurodeles waltl TaxID=8319 RepID=UPI003709C3BD